MKYSRYTQIFKLFNQNLVTLNPFVLSLSKIEVERGSWRPYLHLEHGKVWIVSDDAEWVELE